jgi:hypothetical protein
MAVFGFNLLGDALRDVLDPKLKGEQSLFFKIEKTGHASEE